MHLLTHSLTHSHTHSLRSLFSLTRVKRWFSSNYRQPPLWLGWTDIFGVTYTQTHIPMHTPLLPARRSHSPHYRACTLITSILTNPHSHYHCYSYARSQSWRFPQLLSACLCWSSLSMLPQVHRGLWLGSISPPTLTQNKIEAQIAWL